MTKIALFYQLHARLAKMDVTNSTVRWAICLPGWPNGSGLPSFAVQTGYLTFRMMLFDWSQLRQTTDAQRNKKRLFPE